MLPVNAVRGLNDGTTNVNYHRDSGSASSHLKPITGLTTADAVTLEGTCVYFLTDLQTLREWRKEVTGDKATDIGGEYRSVTIKNNKLDDKGLEVDIDGASGTIELVNCLATKLTISDFDENSPSHLTWTLELRFEKMGD